MLAVFTVGRSNSDFAVCIVGGSKEGDLGVKLALVGVGLLWLIEDWRELDSAELDRVRETSWGGLHSPS